MRHLIPLIAALFVATAMPAQAEEKGMTTSNSPPVVAAGDARVRPGLRNTSTASTGLWRRRELAQARHRHRRGVDRVQPDAAPPDVSGSRSKRRQAGEISEIITRVLRGLPNAMAAARPRRASLRAGTSGPISFRRRRQSPCRSTRRARPTGRRGSHSSSQRYRRAWCNTRPTHCSAMSGCAPTWRRATAAW